MIFVYLGVLTVALYWVIKTLAPEMAKPPLPSGKGRPVQESPFDLSQFEADNTIERLQTLLAEKNKHISLLETDIRIFQAQARAFDQVKAALEEEIIRLRQQNRIFRSELGIPPQQTSNKSSVS